MYEFDVHALTLALPFLFDGLLLSGKITLIAIMGGLIWGMVLALLRLAKLPLLSTLATAYINFFRSVPLMMVLLWFFLIIPQFIKQLFNLPATTEMRLPLAMLGFALFEAAYYAEIIRAGIEGIRRNQVHAAYALGLSHAQTLRWVILPQALRNMAPVLLSQAIILFQDTSLVYVGGLSDFFNAAATQANIQGRYVELYLFAAAVYLVLCSTASYAVLRLQSRLNYGKRL